MAINTAVILSAGMGIRMRPLTLTRQKVMLPIAGKPLLEYTIASLAENSIKDLFIVVGYREEDIKQYFRDGSDYGVNIHYIHQDKQLGSAHAVNLAAPYVKDKFMMIYGDLLITPKAVKFAVKAYEKNKVTTMSVIPVKNPELYGVVKLDGSRVIDIIEKPSTGEAPSNLANAGLYVLTDEIFKAIEKTTPSKRGEFEITDSLQISLKWGVQVESVTLDSDSWMHIGLPWDLLDANAMILKTIKPKIDGDVEGGSHIIGSIVLAEGARIRSGAYIDGPAVIGAGSDIGPNCFIRPYTSIGKDVRVGNACEVKNSIIMDGTQIAHLSYVGDSIIGTNCNLGAGTITANLRFDEKNVKVMIKDKLLDSGKRKLGAIIGDNVKTGINVNFMPGVKIEPNSWIGPGVVVMRDVPQNSFIILKQEHDERKVQ